METLRLLLPVLWSVISTMIGLVLYRTTTARFRVKGLALAGSAIIAAACFIGLDWATPASLRRGHDEVLLRQVRDLADQGTRHTQNAAQACVDSSRDELKCIEELSALSSTLKRTSDAMEALLTPN